MKRVVITGQGVVSALGNNVTTFWQNLLQGKLGIAPIEKFSSEKTGITLAGEVKDFNGEELLGKKNCKRLDLSSQYALVAANEAMEQGKVTSETFKPKELGVIIGSGIGGMTTFESQMRVLDKKGPQRISPFFVPMVIPNMVAGNISLAYHAENLSEVVVTACASGTNAIGEAFQRIQLGKATAMIAGGSEATICEIGISGFAALNALSKSTNPHEASLPFDARRQGFVMGEGAGILLLEELEHAVSRGAEILGEIVGYGVSCDAYHMTSPKPDGSIAKRALKEALQQGNVSLNEVAYINAHGTGTMANDATETTVIKNVFGKSAYEIPISSTKSMIGHLLGAAGGVEAIATVMTLKEGLAHPTLGLKESDPNCDLDYIPETSRKITGNYALSQSFGFGGHNACLCFKKWEEE